MKKRIAIQFFGHLRTFDKTHQSFLDNIIKPNKDKYEIDVFIHTWNELDHSTISYRNPEGKPLTDKKLLPEDIAYAQKIYQPKQFQCEPQQTCPDIVMVEKIGNFKRSLKGCLNMAYTLYKSSELRRQYAEKENICYDWVIVTRPDILFKNEFRLSKLETPYEDGTFSIPEKGLFYAFNPFGRGQLIEEPQFLTGADLFYVARPENVDKATALYTNFKENMDTQNFVCMEVWWGNFWRKQGLTPYPINFLHGPDFDVVKTNENNKIAEYKKTLLKQKIKSALLWCLPYALAKKIFKTLPET